MWNNLGDASSLVEKMDLHIHTNFSDGKITIPQLLKIIKVKNLTLAAVTDHYSEYIRMKNRIFGNEIVGYLDALKSRGLVRGVEVEIFSDGSVSISQQRSKMCDVILGGIHSLNGINFWRDSQPILNPTKYVDRVRVALEAGMESRVIDVLVHVTWLPETIRSEANTLITREWMKSLIDTASDNEVAIELNGAWEVPSVEFVRLCLKQGVKVSVGSDAHTVKEIGNVTYPLKILNIVEANVEDLFIPKVKKV
jgi:putative hydrolase